MGSNKEDDTPQYDDFVRKYIWMVRPCVDYKNEASECTSFKGRFHQYFIYGELSDCSKWSEDVKNCEQCLEKMNNEACKAIIKNETERRMKRLIGVKQNDVWKKRDKPPENWNPPLSEYWLNRSKNSILYYKNDEYKKYVATHEPGGNDFCTIL